VLLDSFSAVTRAPSPVFMFYVPGLIFGGTEGAVSTFHLLRPRLVSGDTEGVGSRFYVLLSRTHFQLYRGRRVQSSCFTLRNSFWTVPGASGLVFMFCAAGLVLGDIEGTGSNFHVFRSRTRFRRYRGRRVLFLYLHSQTHFRRYRGRQERKT
jgi:hypothetical protein